MVGKLFWMALALGLALTGCKEERKKPVEAPPAPVRAYLAAEGEYFVRYRMIAEVKPYQSLDLVARVGGFLQERYFKEGALVKKGDRLYLIEPAQYQIALAQAQAQLAKAQAQEVNAALELTRAGTLFEEKVAPPKRFDSARANAQAAKAEVAAAQASLQQAELNLSYTEINAPFDGWIGLTRVDVGNYIGSPGIVLNQLLAVDKMRIDFHLSDRYLSGELLKQLMNGVDPDWRVRIFFADGTIYPHTGVITFWDNQVSKETATLALQAVFDNPEKLLAPGLIVTLELENPIPEKVVRLDSNAIRFNQGNPFTFVVNRENRLELRPLLLGPEESGDVVIRSGIAAGERAVAGNALLHPGEIVTVIP